MLHIGRGAALFRAGAYIAILGLTSEAQSGSSENTALGFMAASLTSPTSDTR
jgi:hypothetical protein